MSAVLAGGVCLVFVALALWHFWMACVPATDRSAAVPSVAGKPLFVPSRRATAIVGVLLLVCALLVAATAGRIDTGLPRAGLAAASYALAIGLGARAIGDFRHVGFFKRNRDGRFAFLDTVFYSPLCALLATAVAAVAHLDRTPA